MVNQDREEIWGISCKEQRGMLLQRGMQLRRGMLPKPPSRGFSPRPLLFFGFIQLCELEKT